MLFVVDVGNSHTVVGLFEGDNLLGHWRLKSDAERTADELAIRYHSLFEMAQLDRQKIKGIIIASVVPSLEAAWLSCCQKHFSDNLDHPPFIVSSNNLKNIVTIDIDYPEEVGADRLVNAIAAWFKYKKDLIIIDFGTAITFDCITHDCSYIGGAILPGIAISLQALSSRAAKLPHIDISQPPASIIGKSTTEAMKSGVLHGYGSLIDGLVQKLSNEMNCGKNVEIIATGGMANLIAPYTQTLNTVDQMLTLKGLQIIFNQTLTHD